MTSDRVLVRRPLRRGLAGWGVVAALVLSGCGTTASRAAVPTSTVGPQAGAMTSTTVTAAAAFDKASLTYFPGTSLATRRERAQQVCDSIKSNGDNFLTWLRRVATEPSTHLVPFDVKPGQLGPFSGVVVKDFCPNQRWIDQLAQGLAGIPTGVNIGSTSNGSPPATTVAPKPGG